jgi:hypothetical protein
MRVASRGGGNPSSVGDIFETATFRLGDDGRLLMNNAPLSEVQVLLRRGELGSFARRVDSTVPITSSAEAGFRATLVGIPDTVFRQIDETAAIQRLRHPDLDIFVNPNMTPTELANSMTPAARSTFEGAMRKITAFAGTSLSVFGVVALIAIGIDFYQAIIDATLNKRGCFLVRIVGSELTSCRLIERTCWTPLMSNCEINARPPLPFNTTIMLISALRTENSQLAADLGVALGLQGPLTNSNVSQVMSDNGLFTLAEIYFDENAPELLGICDTNSQIEGGIQPLCRACETTAGRDSSQYINTSELADNFSLQCVPTGSILDTLVDIGIGIGVDLLSPFGKISGSISENFFVIMIIVIIAVVVVVVISIIAKSSKD